MNPALTTATLVVRHQVHPQHEQRYETWLHQTIEAASQFPGHLGVGVGRERHGDALQFTSVLRFDEMQHLQEWLASSARQWLVSQAQGWLQDGDNTEVRLGKDFWFAPRPAEQAPPRWKQVVVSFLVILPLSLLVPALWQPVFSVAPWLAGYLISNLLITLSIVVLVVYLFMPLATRMLDPWLTADPA